MALPMHTQNLCLAEAAAELEDRRQCLGAEGAAVEQEGHWRYSEEVVVEEELEDH
jgi:hypothetical protein